MRAKKQENLSLPFLIDIEDLLSKLVVFVLDLDGRQDPHVFTCEGPPVVSRQNLMRECRFIDLLVDCLRYPFSTKVFSIAQLTQKAPMTRICILVYRLLMHCVKGNTLNKTYVALWIDLFFKQAMVTTEDNNFGASDTIAELLKDNAKMLDEHIDEKIIKELI